MIERAGTRDVQLVVAAVDRCRARLRLVACVRCCAAASLVALIPIEMLLVVSAAERARLWTAAIVTIASALVGAVVYAIVRTPGPAAAAAILDRRLAAGNVVETAFECGGDQDPVAQLVARDAASRVRSLRLAALFPLEAPRRLGALAAAALLVPIVATLATRGRLFLAQESSAGVADAAGPIAGTAQRKAAGASAHQMETGSPVAARGSERTDSSAVPPRTTIDPVGGRDLAARTALDPRRAIDAVGRAETRGTAGDAGGHDSGGAARGASVGGTAARQADASGGVTGASLLPGTPSLPSPAPRADGAYRAAWTKAQSPVAQERVPLRLRGYVRKYFTAIRPEDQQ
jgi:hypothetical protein